MRGAHRRIIREAARRFQTLPGKIFAKLRRHRHPHRNSFFHQSAGTRAQFESGHRGSHPGSRLLDRSFPPVPAQHENLADERGLDFHPPPGHGNRPIPRPLHRRQSHRRGHGRSKRNPRQHSGQCLGRVGRSRGPAGRLRSAADALQRQPGHHQSPPDRHGHQSPAAFLGRRHHCSQRSRVSRRHHVAFCGRPGCTLDPVRGGGRHHRRGRPDDSSFS